MTVGLTPNVRNLRSFKKGQRGNPSGRPSGLSITALVRAELQKPSEDDPSVTKGQQVALQILALAARRAAAAAGRRPRR